MQALGAQMGVAAKHLPILVARNQSHLLDLKSRFEQPTGPLMTQIVEVKVDNP